MFQNPDLPKLEYAVVCIEKHVDGNPHIHAVFVLDDLLTIKDCTYFDCLVGKHGNYQGCRSPKKTLEYVVKDGEYVSFGIDVSELLKKKGSDYSVAVSMLIAGHDMTDIFEQLPGTYGLHYSSLSRVHMMIVSRAGTPHQWSVTADRNTILQASPVGRWLVTNLTGIRPRRMKQLFLKGPPGCGKSSLAAVLRKCLLTYTFPDDPHFEDWKDNVRLVIYDEPEAHRLRFMNKFLSGETIRLPARYNTVVKSHNPPFIFLSNNDPDQIYKEASLPHNTSYPNYIAFLDRLEIVEVDQNLLTLVRVLEGWYP